MASFQVVIWNSVLKQLQAKQLGDSYLLAGNTDISGTLFVNGSINGRNLTNDGAKVDLLTLSLPIDLDEIQTAVGSIETVTDYIGVTANTDLDALRTKSNLISVTQPVDLDSIETRVDALTSVVTLKGTWDPSLGTFPVSTLAGESWIATAPGSIGGEDFLTNDRIIALVDGASINSYGGQWIRQTYTGEVVSVAGKSGAVQLYEADITDLQSYLLPSDIDTLTKLSIVVGETVMTQESINTLVKLNAIVADATLIDTTDVRLSDARTPVAHTHGPEDVLGLPVVKSYNFSARTLSSGVYYLAGFYESPAADANLTQAAPTINFGDANCAHASHAFMVFGGGSTDGANITITVSGTSITDAGVRTPADSEVLYSGPVAGLTLNDYLETPKKWLNTVTYTLTSDGVNFTCDFNYGFAKYEDNSNNDYYLVGVEAVGLCDTTDAGFNIELLPHVSTGWTYSAAAFVPGSAALLAMQTDHGGDYRITAGEHFAWKRLFAVKEFIEGSAMEGVLIRVTTTANNAIAYMNAHLTAEIVYPAP